MVYNAEPLSERRFLLGEGPVWDARRGRLAWVDIKTGALLECSIQGGELLERQTGQYLGAAVPTQRGHWLCAMATGLYLLGEKGLVSACSPPGLSCNQRLNDGKCDPAGRFWFGTIALFPGNEDGALYRLDPDGNCHRILDGVTVSNGLAWSTDGSTMYFNDTPTRRVDAFDYDKLSGRISNRRTVFSTREGFPDGMTIDDEGMLWVALWQGGKVLRVDPAAGRVVGEIPLPAVNVTSACFAGAGLDSLCITTSGEGYTEPGAGRVYLVKPGVKGAPTHLFDDSGAVWSAEP